MLQVTVLPRRVLIERDEFGQYLSFDFLLQNPANEALKIEAVRATVLDADGKLMARKMVDRNAMAPSLETLGRLQVEPEGELYIYNPFHTFAPDMRIASLKYDFVLADSGGNKTEVRVLVLPQEYETRTDLILPMKGRLIVYDGHEYLSHHRRVDPTHFVAKQIGLTSLPGRYGYDLCVVDNDGAMFRGEGKRNEDWFGYGAPEYAPGEGMVIKAVNDQPDNILGERMFDSAEGVKNPSSAGGNRVLIDRGNEEHSFLAHMKQGSVAVRAADRVRQGQHLGQMGLSGDTWMPHLHYELRDGPDPFRAEGLPSYFRDFHPVLGSEVRPVDTGRVDTGDIIEC